MGVNCPEPHAAVEIHSSLEVYSTPQQCVFGGEFDLKRQAIVRRRGQGLQKLAQDDVGSCGIRPSHRTSRRRERRWGTTRRRDDSHQDLGAGRQSLPHLKRSAQQAAAIAFGCKVHMRAASQE